MYANKLYCNAWKKDQHYFLGIEFNRKVQFDFTRIVFIGVQPQYVKNLFDVVELSSKQHGYQSHRTITYKENVCHLYVKYNTTAEAKITRDFFRNREGFYAELVDDILLGWYVFEMTSECEHRQTIGFLDVVGEVSHTQPLSEDIARSLLVKFGKPLIQYAQSDHVRVAFSSIAEGIGACIVYGNWFVKNSPQDPRFYYRVQLEQSDYFSEMVNHGNSTPCNKDSFHLEYFSPRICTPSSPDPIFTYENTGCHNYLSTVEPRNSRHFYRGRGNYKYQRGGKNSKQQRNYQNKGRSGGYQQFPQDYPQMDPPVDAQFVYQSNQTSTENFQCR